LPARTKLANQAPNATCNYMELMFLDVSREDVHDNLLDCCPSHTPGHSGAALIGHKSHVILVTCSTGHVLGVTEWGRDDVARVT
jgi:hypothetical protein